MNTKTTEQEKTYQSVLDAADAADTALFALIESLPDTALQDRFVATIFARQDAYEVITRLGNADPAFLDYAKMWTALKYGTPEQTNTEALH